MSIQTYVVSFEATISGELEIRATSEDQARGLFLGTARDSVINSFLDGPTHVDIQKLQVKYKPEAPEETDGKKG